MELAATAGSFIAANAGTIAGAASLAGTVGQTIAGVQQARTSSKFSKAEAESARLAAAAEEASSRRRAAQVLSKQRAIGAASGVDISSGSPLELMLDSAKEAELNALNIRYGGELKRQSKLTESELARGTIPGTVFGGVAKGGSILSQWLKK